MAIKAAELQVVIGADTSPAVVGIQRAMGMINQSASMALGYLGGQLAVGALNSLRSLGVEAFSAAAEFERLELTLGTLVKRDLANTGQSLELVGEKTQDLLEWTRQLAKHSPFDMEGVVTALRTAMAYGFTTEQAKRLTQATIDFAAGAGLSSDAMNQIALALGQIQAKGKLAGQEVLQLVNAGIDVRATLAKYLGKTVTEISGMMERGLIDANTAIEAILTTLETDFAGAAEKQTMTWSGLLSTFQEIKKLGLAKFFDAVAESLRPVVAKFLEWLEGPGIENLQKLGENISSFIAKVVNIGDAFADAGPFSKKFSNALATLSPTLGELWEKARPFVQNVLEWLRKHSAEVTAAIKAMMAAFAGVAIIGGIISLVSSLANPLMLILTLTGLLAAAWTGNWGGIRDALAGFISYIKNLAAAFADTGSVFSSEFLEALTSFLPQDLQGKVMSFVSGIVESISNVDWAGLFGSFNQGIVEASGWIQTNLLPAIQQIATWMLESLIPAIQDVSAWFSANLPAAFAAFSAFYQQYVQPVIQTIVQYFQTVFPQVIAFFVGLWNGVLLPILTVLGDILQNVLWPVLSAIADLLGAVLSVAFEAVVGAIQNLVLPALEQLWMFINTSILPLITKLVTWLVVNLKPAFDVVAAAVAKVVEFIEKMAAAIRSIKLPSWLEMHSPPPLATGLEMIADGFRQSAAEAATLNSMLQRQLAPTYAMTPSAAAQGQQQTVYNVSFNMADTTLDEGQLITALRRMEFLYA